MLHDAVDPAQREIGQRTYIEVDHGQLLAAIESGRLAMKCKACIVDDDRGLKPAPEQFVRNARRRIGALQVLRDHDGFVFRRNRDLGCEQGHFLLAACNEGDLVAVAGEHARQRRADADRSAGNDRDRFEDRRRRHACLAVEV